MNDRLTPAQIKGMFEAVDYIREIEADLAYQRAQLAAAPVVTIEALQAQIAALQAENESLRGELEAERAATRIALRTRR